MQVQLQAGIEQRVRLVRGVADVESEHAALDQAGDETGLAMLAAADLLVNRRQIVAGAENLGHAQGYGHLADVVRQALFDPITIKHLHYQPGFVT